MQDKRPRANREDRLTTSGLLGHEVNEDVVIDLLARPLAAGHEEAIQWRAIGERRVRIDRHPFRADDRLAGLRDHDATLWPLEMLAPHRNHFPRADEVEFLQTREKQKSKIHGPETLGEVRCACNTDAGLPRSIRLLVMLGTTGAVGNGIIFMKNGAGRQR